MENTILTPDEIQDRIDMLEQAQQNLKEAITLIKDALHRTEHETHAHSYIIAHLQDWLTHPRFNMGLDDYIEAFKNYGVEEEQYDEF